MAHTITLVHLIGLGKVRNLVLRLGEAKRRRILMRSLEEMSDYQLRDIGMSRDSLTAAAFRQSLKRRNETGPQER